MEPTKAIELLRGGYVLMLSEHQEVHDEALDALLSAYEERGREIERLRSWPDCEQCDVPMLQRNRDEQRTYFCAVCEAEEKQRQAERQLAEARASGEKMREAGNVLASLVRAMMVSCGAGESAAATLWDALAASPAPARIEAQAGEERKRELDEVPR